ncbi:hypothetical protein J8L85_12780 [Maribacter sp. MMG018]|uniref:hypothetical protein n=1 Tax=Maribacter sp. MMG018 TaxID=2822688 RepID=UPI001B38E8B4|nr:hypothetical protein [Maribacter sp. MMG018]MBQ4915320.1 hypothetical protein [Maribacter sp. MMG018]
MVILERKASVRNHLRISLNQKWSNVDFINFLTAIQNIYELYILSEEINSMEDFESSFQSNPTKTSLIITYLEQNFMQSDSTMMIRDKTETSIYNNNDSLRLKFLIKNELQIIRINYASPGFADIGGFGAAIGHIKDLILRIIDFFENRRSNKLDNDRKEIQNDILRIDKTKKIVELLRDINYPESKILKILETENNSIKALKSLVESKQIENVE